MQMRRAVFVAGVVFDKNEKFLRAIDKDIKDISRTYAYTYIHSQVL